MNNSCDAIRHYLAVYHDLTLEQQQFVDEHIRTCPVCAQEQLLSAQVERKLQRLKETMPSTQVDQAIRVAIQKRYQHPVSQIHQYGSLRSTYAVHRKPGKLRLASILAVAAVFILVLASSLAFFVNRNYAFAFPDNVAWGDYVLYYKQTMSNSTGERYEVMSYYYLSKQMVNVETVMHGKFDVVVVKNQRQSLGLDKMRRVAEWDVEEHPVANTNPTSFDQAKLKQDLTTGKAHYLGKDTFKGQEVYKVQLANGDILLLDMEYMPVNVISKDSQNSMQQPMYDTVRWLPPDQVSDELWAMTVPEDFSMGELPTMP